MDWNLESFKKKLFTHRVREWDRERAGGLFVITSTTSSSSSSSSASSLLSPLAFRKFRCRFTSPGDAVINVTESLLSLSANVVSATSLIVLSSVGASEVVAGAPERSKIQN